MIARAGAPLTSVVALALLLSSSAATGAEPGGEAALRFGHTEHRFGTVAQGDRVSAEFPFENAGVVPLTLSPPIVGCGCQAEIVGSSDIAPAASGLIRVSCDTSNMSGAVRRTATIHSSDVARRAVLLTMLGEVRLDVLAEPSEIYLGKVLRGQRVKEAFSVFLGSSEGRRVSLRGAGTTGPHLEVERDGRSTRFGLKIDPKAPLGSFTQEVTVATSSARFSTLTVPVTGTVVEELPKRRW